MKVRNGDRKDKERGKGGQQRERERGSQCGERVMGDGERG